MTGFSPLGPKLNIVSKHYKTQNITKMTDKSDGILLNLQNKYDKNIMS